MKNFNFVTAVRHLTYTTRTQLEYQFFGSTLGAYSHEQSNVIVEYMKQAAFLAKLTR
jgi:hypothetical protein